MPPSQLKQLKASLRDSGVLGPQKSKKQKQQNAKSGVSAQNRAQRNAALQAIRDRFNPFEIKVPSKQNKFDVTTRDSNSKASAGHRPGVTKSMGEEKRRQTLLREMNRRNKVGGIMDRRFGEDDPTMTPEERVAERFARESQKKMRKESVFNLEDEDEDEFQLTHMGESLNFEADDFDAGDLGGADDDMSDSETPRKRKRVVDDEDAELEGLEDLDEDVEEEQVPERKKSKQEVMKEVIAKSKFHKLERQKAKEDDDDLREELDQGLTDLFSMLRGVKPPPQPEAPKDDFASMNPERAALIESATMGTDKEYDQRIRQMTFDKRSMPTDRTMTEEEKIEEEARKLKALEEERLRRMRGEELSDEDEEEEEDKGEEESGDESDEESVPDDAMAFGLQQPDSQFNARADMGVEDEDDFILDDDLVETRSDVSLEFDDSDDDEEMVSGGESEEEQEDGEDDLINGMTLPEDKTGSTSITVEGTEDAKDGLKFTYPCPRDHEGFLKILKNVSVQDVPTVIQRIRALHHPRLHPDNKMKLGRFGAVLVKHVAYMAEQPEQPPFAVLENVLRHIHSLAKSHPENVCMAFRARLREMSTERPLNLQPADLVILTGIATIFPTSDHFHAIATPAQLCLARYLGQGPVDTLADFATGTYAATLYLQYQGISKRYMPEFINYILNTLSNLSPEQPKTSMGSFPSRSPEQSLRLSSQKAAAFRKLRFWDITAGPDSGKRAQEELKLSIIVTLVNLLNTASDLWAGKSAYIEIFEPTLNILNHLSTTCKSKIPSSAREILKSTKNTITAHIDQAYRTRRPLLLHNHKPLAIKSAIPKFEETFNPDKHYDPNRERAELNRVKKEYKREHKGAMRELRKDANFIAREKLRDKKDRDSEYEKKYKRLVAEVQNQEGRAANEYEKERKLRQGKK